MTSIRKVGFAFLISTVGGCSADTASSPDADLSAQFAAGTVPCPGTRTVVEFTPRFGCGSIIKVRPAPNQPSAAAAIGSAVANWNSALSAVPVPLPTFSAVAAGAAADVTVTIVGTAETYCGEATANSVTLYAANSSHCSNANHSDAGTTLTHELAHVFGFEGGGGEKRVPGYSDHCTTHLPFDNTIINGFICQHELEVIMQGYGHLPNGDPNFWGKHVITGLAVATVPVGDTANPYLMFARSNIGSAPRGGVALAGSSADNSKAQLLASGWIRGVSAGSTSVTASINPSTLGGTDYALSGLIAQSPSTFPVTVTPAPPPPPNPDLAPTASVPFAVQLGGTIAVNVYQWNHGNLTAPGGWKGVILLSQDLVPGAGDVTLYQYVESRSIGVGSSPAVITPSLTFPASMQAGPYYVLFQLDAAGQVAEQNEANNTLARPVTLSQCVWPTGIMNPLLGGYASKTGAGNCAGRTGILTNGTTSTSGRARFDAACTVTQQPIKPDNSFTVRGCKVGTGAKLTIYNNGQVEKIYSISVTYEPIE